MAKVVDDRTLIANYLDGDKTSICELVKRHQHLVYNLCFQMAGNACDAQDLTQEIFIRLLDKIGAFRGEAKFSTWLYKMALNYCRDYLRRRQLDTVEVNDRLFDPKPGPEDIACAAETQDMVFAALLALPIEWREVVFLCDIEGFSYKEIAGILEIEIGTVKSRLARARGRLFEIIEPESKPAKGCSGLDGNNSGVTYVKKG